MPQELHALQCSECATYQVHIVKKIPKWTCKICGIAQCVQKIFAKGTGQSCREVVQILNQKRILGKLSNLQDEGCDSSYKTESACIPLFSSKNSSQTTSKWNQLCTSLKSNPEELNEDVKSNCLQEIAKREESTLLTDERNTGIKFSKLESPLWKKRKIDVDTKIDSVDLEQPTEQKKIKITRGIFEDDDDFNIDNIEL